jgi:hypothetical protein
MVGAQTVRMPLVVVALGVVFGVAAIAGFRLGRTWMRFYLLLAFGLAAQAAAGAAVVVHEPTGEGWSGRVDVFGHWVPTARMDAVALAFLPWMIGLAIGAVAAVVSRPGAPAGVSR